MENPYYKKQGPKDRFILESGWMSPMMEKTPSKNRWIIRALMLGGGGVLVALGLYRIFVAGRLEGIRETALGVVFILLWPLLEWAIRQKSLMGTCIDIVGMEKEEMLKLAEEYLRSRGYRFRPNKENFLIIKGEGFELTDSGVRLTVFSIRQEGHSDPVSMLRSNKASRLGIRNIDNDNLQTAIGIQIELDKVFQQKGIHGSPPRKVPVAYRWTGKEYKAIV